MPGCKVDPIGAESHCQFDGLMKYCPDGNVMTQKGFYTVILHPRLGAGGQSLTSSTAAFWEAQCGTSRCQTNKEATEFQKPKEVVFISSLPRISNRRFFRTISE